MKIWMLINHRFLNKQEGKGNQVLNLDINKNIKNQGGEIGRIITNAIRNASRHIQRILKIP